MSEPKVVPLKATLNLSGTLVYRNAAGEICGTADFSGGVPIERTPEQIEEIRRTLEAANGTDRSNAA